MKRNSPTGFAAVFMVALILTFQAIATAQPARKQSVRARFHLIYQFQGGQDGFDPVGVIRDAPGNFFGATFDGGGTSCDGGQGCGVVFKLDNNKVNGVGLNEVETVV